LDLAHGYPPGVQGFDLLVDPQKTALMSLLKNDIWLVNTKIRTLPRWALLVQLEPVELFPFTSADYDPVLFYSKGIVSRILIESQDHQTLKE